MAAIRDLAAMQVARRLFPGLLLAGIVAMAARFLSEHYGAPVMLMALLIGMAFNFLSEEEDGRCAPGIDFAAANVLRFGVGLLGLGITVQQVFSLGGTAVAFTVAGMIVTLCGGLVLARLIGGARGFGVLAGGAVAICGASAALAISSVIPNHPHKDRDTVFTVIAVTTLSTIAMIAYPILGAELGLSDRETGVFLGATIHDVAQVVGAGYSVSNEAGDTATIIKLFRVAMLVPLVLILSLLLVARTRGESGAARVPIPYFVVGFVVLVIAGSYGLIPGWASEPLLDLARFCLVMAIAGLGMKTSLKKLAEVGGPAIGMFLGLTITLAAISLALILTVGL